MRDCNATTLSPRSTGGRVKGQCHNHEILPERQRALKIRCDTGRIQRYSLFGVVLPLSAGRGDEVRVTATYLVFGATRDRPRPSQIVIAVLNA